MSTEREDIEALADALQDLVRLIGNLSYHGGCPVGYGSQELERAQSILMKLQTTEISNRIIGETYD